MAEEKRIDPEDNVAYTFDELSAFYKNKYKKKALQAYWDDECTPLKTRKGKKKAAEPKAPPPAPAKAAPAKTAPAKTAPEPEEKRIDPEDNVAYTFEELAAFYKNKYKKKALQAYWDDECTPLKTKKGKKKTAEPKAPPPPAPAKAAPAKTAPAKTAPEPEELRIDPDDGEPYTLEEMREFYAGKMKKKAVDKLWQKCEIYVPPKKKGKKKKAAAAVQEEPVKPVAKAKSKAVAKAKEAPKAKATPKTEEAKPKAEAKAKAKSKAKAKETAKPKATFRPKVDPKTGKWTIVYHPGNFKGRAEFIRLILEDAGVEYTESNEGLYGPTGVCDAFIKKGDSAPASYEDLAADNAPFPVMFPPILHVTPPEEEIARIDAAITKAKDTLTALKAKVTTLEEELSKADEAAKSEKEGKLEAAKTRVSSGENKITALEKKKKNMEVYVNQVPAILRFCAAKLGYLPPGPEAVAKADEVMLNATDFLAEGCRSFHPVDHALEFEKQKDEAIKASTKFAKERMPTWLGHFEKVVKRLRPEADGPLFGKATYADFALFHAVDAAEAQFNTDTYEKAWDKAEVPTLKKWKAWMASREKLGAYLASDRRKPWEGNSMM